jgi:quercetin dioxygenase-like cupin family protein
MQCISVIISGFLIVGAFLVTVTSAQQEQLTPFEVFDGTITLQDRQLRVIIRNWGILNGQQIPQFPQEGFLIAQLRNGSLTTVIDGERQERHEGEFWTVPADSSMSVETGNDLAILQTVAVRPTGVIE